MTTMKDILDLVDFTKSDECHILHEFERELDTDTLLYHHEEFGKRVREQGINNWTCTDTEVGVYAFFFDGQFIAIGFKKYRKYDMLFRWVSEDVALKVRVFIRSLDDYRDRDIVIHDIDEKEEIDARWLSPFRGWDNGCGYGPF